MITVIGLSGSLRSGSYNTAVLRAAASLMPDESELQIESIANIPLYNGDDETAHGIPEPVARLKDAIAAADGLLLVTPRVQQQSSRSDEERDRLALAAAERHRACFSREARRDRGRLAGWIRHDSFAECVASRLPHAGGGTVVGRPTARVESRQRDRRERGDHRCCYAREHRQIHRRLRRASA